MRSLSRSSIRQKTATMKVLRSTKEDLRYVWCYSLNTERREVFFPTQVLKETCAPG